MMKYINSFSIYLFAILAIPLFFGVFSPDVAHAKSETLEKSFSDKLISSGGFIISDGTGWWLQNTKAQITYNVSVLDKATGAVIPEDATVSVGQDIILKFEEHKGTDIYWFTNVGSKARITSSSVHIDSPYGSWKQNAAEPDVIDEDDYLGKALVGIHTTTYVCDKCAQDGNKSIRYIYASVYAALTANYPAKTIETPSNLTCGTLSGVDSSGARTMQCKVNADGPININFKFSDTYGKFYSPTLIKSGASEDIFLPTKPYLQMQTISGSCGIVDGKEVCWYQGSPFTLNIPETSIPYTLKASAVPNDPPNAPDIDGPQSICVNSESTYGFTATDQNEDKVAYFVDYTGDTQSDLRLPPSASEYVSSGTRETTSSIRWSEAGAHTISAYTLDERGLTSNKTTYAVQVSDTGACAPPITVTLTADDDTVYENQSTVLRWSTGGDPDSCEASADPANAGWNAGTNPNPASGGPPHSKSVTLGKDDTTFEITCSKAGHLDVFAEVTVDVECNPLFEGCDPPPPGESSISVDPARVRSGNKTKVSWKVNEAAGKCMIGGTNGDTVNPLKPPLEGSEDSSSITAQTTYVLLCENALPDEATVNVVPSYQEI